MPHRSQDHPPLPSHQAVEAWFRLMRAQRSVLSAIDADLLAAGQPPLAVYDILYVLSQAHEGSLDPAEIGRRAMLAQADLVPVLDRLADEGFVLRDDPDAKGGGLRIAIAPAGRELRLKMWEVYEPSIERHLGARMSEVDANVLATLLAKLL
ncbi:MarR family transcriptional regulator [Rhizobium sp. TRM95111]|uniref:MarR family winged helix-turn-helix transcriptional regulator n=1 Tax=Rhizobium alarense TaxID=2846851 RepID=UPI001F233681|nr:MarR family transcriptional regulator [Rhizobium alarense]MCF3642535.1 MarR family transcriptional regulator [Rhizobium alarense]